MPASSDKVGKRRGRSRFVAAFLVVAHALGFATSIVALMSTRTPQGTIAWAISLNTFPYVAVPAYWIFGRNNFNGYVTARQAGDLELEGLPRANDTNIGEYMISVESGLGQIQALERLAKLSLLGGNSAQLLIDGEATYTSIFEGIDRAQDYVLVQYYIVNDDTVGRELQERLIRKAQQGVRVYFLYDEIGSRGLADYNRGLREAGVEVSAFNTTKGPGNRFQLNFRNHRKIVVVDGREAWVGGLNIGEEHLGVDPKYGPWRDTHARIEGPAVMAAQLSFVEDWNWATDRVPPLTWQVIEPVPGDVPILVLPSGPADSRETAGLFFTHAINSARVRVWIASPYFVPDEAVLSALQLAALRGVDVRILIPDEPDQMLVYLAAFSYLDELSDFDIALYRYEPGFMHQKVMLVDDVAAAVGTANLDNRSFRLNFEITLMFFDRAFAGQVEAMFLEDFRRSRLMQADEVRTRSFWFRLAIRFARLASPIL